MTDSGNNHFYRAIGNRPRIYVNIRWWDESLILVPTTSDPRMHGLETPTEITRLWIRVHGWTEENLNMWQRKNIAVAIAEKEWNVLYGTQPTRSMGPFPWLQSWYRFVWIVVVYGRCGTHATIQRLQGKIEKSGMIVSDERNISFESSWSDHRNWMQREHHLNTAAFINMTEDCLSHNPSVEGRWGVGSGFLRWFAPFLSRSQSKSQSVQL